MDRLRARRYLKIGIRRVSRANKVAADLPACGTILLLSNVRSEIGRYHGAKLETVLQSIKRSGSRLTWASEKEGSLGETARVLFHCLCSNGLVIYFYMIDRVAKIVLVAAIGCVLSVAGRGEEIVKPLKDIEYAKVGSRSLGLDLYLPENDSLDGIIVWIHGGAWRSGSKNKVPALELVEQGWALASVDYRLSGEARFPAQIHDIKAAIRFLRAKSQEYGFRAENVFIMGSSAGGHLAALAGVTNGHDKLEGNVGEHANESSDIQGIVSLYGASNLTSILDQSTPHGLSVRGPALDMFIGGHPDDVAEIARLASPVFHVDADDPPLLLIHGDQDPQMPINQSHELEGRYESVGAPVIFEALHGAKHGGKMFYDTERLQRMHRFLAGIVGGL